ncbi:MAG TPA: hypothetical protein VMT18_09325 [Planctomycetota bacterium]|nr:hypothetical protein [Planctomycetota bacterium]
MQSKMILAVCVILFTMSALWTMAVPEPRPREQRRSEPAAAVPAATARPALPSDHVDGVWSPPGFGLRLSAPPQWQATRSRGRARLICDPSDPDRGRFELSIRAQLGAEDPAARAAALTAVLSARSGFELLADGPATIGTRAARRLEYRTLGANREPLRTLALLWTSGPQELLLEFSAAERHWAQMGAIGAAGLASLDLGPQSR